MGDARLDRSLHLVVGDDRWMNDAACAGQGPDVMFPVTDAKQRRAARVCGGCPVRQECLRYALDNRIEWGVWGGLTEAQRRSVHRQLRHDRPLEDAVAAARAETPASPTYPDLEERARHVTHLAATTPGGIRARDVARLLRVSARQGKTELHRLRDRGVLVAVDRGLYQPAGGDGD